MLWSFDFLKVIFTCRHVKCRCVEPVSSRFYWGCVFVFLNLSSTLSTYALSYNHTTEKVYVSFFSSQVLDLIYKLGLYQGSKKRENANIVATLPALQHHLISEAVLHAFLLTKSQSFDILWIWKRPSFHMSTCNQPPFCAFDCLLFCLCHHDGNSWKQHEGVVCNRRRILVDE